MLSYSEGLFNLDEDLNIEAATVVKDYSPFPQFSDDDETSTDGMWGSGLQGTLVWAYKEVVLLFLWLTIKEMSVLIIVFNR